MDLFNIKLNKMKISGDKIELSELFTGLVLKSGKTKIEITEIDGGFFIQFNGIEIRLIENKLDFISKLKWYWKQWKFERCVGYHWTYPNRKRGKGFYYRNPKWLYVWLFNRYYKR